MRRRTGALRALLAALLAAAAAEECVSSSLIDFNYCGDFIEYDVAASRVNDSAALERYAFAAYQEELAEWRADAITNDCLAYQAFMKCIEQFPKCVGGVEQPICRSACEENHDRCSEEDDWVAEVACDGLPTEQCSAGAGVGAFACLWALALAGLLSGLLV